MLLTILYNYHGIIIHVQNKQGFCCTYGTYTHTNNKHSSKPLYTMLVVLISQVNYDINGKVLTFNVIGMARDAFTIHVIIDSVPILLVS